MFSSAYSPSSISLKKRKRDSKAKAGQQKRLDEESERLVRKITEGYEQTSSYHGSFTAFFGSTTHEQFMGGMMQA
ncbi:hypothetical protein L3X38_035736 [Prunus dulcis]|uniref:Uncharacterized protein n=1 Tax=Prunus dulcis TaxID=3755 RepID=A0AAD4YY45_PRUDU|nr:hypothetical protein L3X38_035736 [Prunus dulcis]